MKPSHLAVFILHCILFINLTPDRPAYQLFNPKGKAIAYEKLLKQAADADVVLFGELHNNPICHWLELQLTKDLYALKKDRLVLGAEMFETDNQTALTNYVQGSTTSKEFAQQARFWPNYATDYRPLVDFARTHKLNFIASNVPRRYASLVARHGLAALDTVANKQWLAPLPLTVDLTLPGYKGMIDMMSSDSAHGGATADSNRSSGSTPSRPTEPAANFARAQAIKDATMAHSILQGWQPGRLLMHLNGDYHSKNFEGISWYLRQQNPALRIFTISSVEQSDTHALEKANQNVASAIVVIPTDMTKTY